MMPQSPKQYRPPGYKPQQRSRAGQERHKWYDRRIWRDKLRPAQLRHQSLCEECEAAGLIEPATDVDHVIPFGKSWELFIDPQNHQSLCHSHHSRKTAASHHHGPH